MGRILVPVDGSAQSKVALEKAFERFPDAAVLAVHVVQVSDLPVENDESAVDLARWDAAEVLDAVEKIAATYDREIHFDTTEGHAVDAIVDYADETDVDRILIGSADRSGVRRLLCGSVAESVQKNASCPVTIVR